MADLSPDIFSELLINLGEFFTHVLAFPFMGTSFITLACVFLFLYVLIRAFIPKG